MHIRALPLVVGLVVTALACSNAGSGFDTSGADAGEAGPDDDVAAPIKGDSALPTPAISCSDDLHSVVDATGNVIKTCPPDQGCGANGTCVPACDSARANKSSLGCDYFNYSPDIVPEAQGACFAAFVANTWTAPITITVDYGGQMLDVSKFARLPSGNGQGLTYKGLNGGQLQPGEVAILFLSHLANTTTPLDDIPCPIPAAIESTDAAVHGTAIGTAFHIGTTSPVVAYDIFPYGGGQTAATSATLLLPVSAWDVNYLAINAYASSTIPNAGKPSLSRTAILP